MTMPSDPIERLERRIERLTSVVIIQSILLTMVVLMDVLQLAPYIALFLIVAVPLLVFYRRQLPGIARWVGQKVGRFRSDVTASTPSGEEKST